MFRCAVFRKRLAAMIVKAVIKGAFNGQYQGAVTIEIDDCEVIIVIREKRILRLVK